MLWSLEEKIGSVALPLPTVLVKLHASVIETFYCHYTVFEGIIIFILWVSSFLKYLFVSQTEDDESDNCAVCLDGYKASDVVRILPCQWVGLFNSVKHQLPGILIIQTILCLL